MDERAVLGIAREDVGTMVVAAFHRCGFHVEPQARLPLVATVAVVTMHLENRAHVADEINRSGMGSSCK
jgi:hypothetical protein